MSLLVEHNCSIRKNLGWDNSYARKCITTDNGKKKIVRVVTSMMTTCPHIRANKRIKNGTCQECASLLQKHRAEELEAEKSAAEPKAEDNKSENPKMTLIKEFNNFIKEILPETDDNDDKPDSILCHLYRESFAKNIDVSDHWKKTLNRHRWI